MDSIHYAPQQEDISKLVELSDPKEKSVLTVSAYGYALPFIAAGAKNVTSFDISPKQTAWNHFVRSMIINTNFEYNQAFFYHPFFENPREKHIEVPWELLLKDIPETYQSDAISLASSYLFDRTDIKNTEDIRIIYPQLIESNFELMQKGMKNWKIIEGEFTDILEYNPQTFDIINGSTIRSWVYRKGRGTYYYPTPFTRAYDKPLFAQICKKLNKNGRFIETEVIGIPFPFYSFHKKNFQIKSYHADTTQINILTKL